MIERLVIGADEYPPEKFWAEYLPDETTFVTEMTAEYPDLFHLDGNPDDGEFLTITAANGVARYWIKWDDEIGCWHCYFESWHSSLT